MPKFFFSISPVDREGANGQMMQMEAGDVPMMLKHLQIIVDHNISNVIARLSKGGSIGSCSQTFTLESKTVWTS